MRRTRVKICGITRADDALAAVDAGVDAIGLVFAEASPRHVTLTKAAAIAARIPAFVTVVGLFVDSPAERVHEAQGALRLDLLQFHGQERPHECRHGRPYLKAIAMTPGADPRDAAARYADAAGLVLDAYVPGIAGGTGVLFDWDLVPGGLALPVVLAGGLNARNVGEAIRRLRPYAVDVSGGVESAPGVKDHERIRDFVREVRSADEACQ